MEVIIEDLGIDRWFPESIKEGDKETEYFPQLKRIAHTALKTT